MNLATLALLGAGAAILLKRRGDTNPAGLPHDKVIGSFDDLVVGMSWSATDGVQWTLQSVDPATGNVTICRTVNTQAGSGTLTSECQTIHFTALQARQDTDSGILLMNGQSGSGAAMSPLLANIQNSTPQHMGDYPFRSSAPSGYIVGPSWRFPDPWSSGGAWGLQPRSHHDPAGPAQMSGTGLLPYRSNPERPGCHGMGCVR